MRTMTNPITRTSLIILLSGIFSLFIISSFSFISKSDHETIAPVNPQYYKIISPEFPDEIVFCGEAMPREDFDVWERLDREIIINTYWHSSTLINLKRAGRWFPMIEKILKENGLPDDFKYLALIESGLTNAVSPAGATGFWQFLKSTGKKYGLEINSNVDERYNIEKSTEAACMYLKEAYEKFGSWTLAAASYNRGMNGITGEIEDQRVDSYYDLLLNEETSRYVFRILAAKTIYENQNKYGFYLSDKEIYKPLEYYEVKVDFGIKDLTKFAFDQGINYKKLKLYNPWLRQQFLENKSKKTYRVKIPKEK